MIYRMKNRQYSLDIIRILACVMIILMHSPIPGIGTSGIVLSGLSFITAPGIGLFFMVSGALLLKQKGEEFDTRGFLKKRFTKILIPLVFWSAVSFALDLVGIKNTELGILWFMYTLAGLYLLTPILVRWLKAARQWELELYLIIWMLSMCYPFVKLLMPLDESDTSWIYYFHGYVGYYVLGYYLQKYSFDKLRWGVVISLFLVFSILAPFLVVVSHLQVDFYSLFWYLSISVAMWCVMWWKGICRFDVSKIMNERTKNIIVKLSNLCFGIYLIHILVMRNVLWQMEWMQNMNGALQIVVCMILTFMISTIISLFVSKIIYLKTVIGG